jgi:hypothetical protein
VCFQNYLAYRLRIIWHSVELRKRATLDRSAERTPVTPSEPVELPSPLIARIRIELLRFGGRDDAAFCVADWQSSLAKLSLPLRVIL